MDSSLKNYLGKTVSSIALLLPVQAVASAYFSYLGAEALSDAGGVSVLGRASAVVYAAAIGAAIYSFWTIALRVVPTLPSGRFRKAGMSITFAGCLFVTAVSSWLNVAGLAGPAALEVQMNGTVAAYEGAAADAYGRARQAEQLIGDLKATARQFHSLAEDEATSGRISGRPGHGTVSETLAHIADQIEGLIEEINGYLEAAATLSQTARGQLETMRQQAGSDGHPTQKMRALASTADAMRATLHEMRSKSPAASAARVIRSLSAGVAVQPVSGRSEKVAAAQREALADVAQRIDAAAATIAALAADLDDPDDPSAGALVVERIGPVQAVFRHAEHFVPMWAGGIAIDLIPTIIILYLMLVFSVRQDTAQQADRTRELTVEQIRDAMAAMALLRNPTAQLPPKP